MIMIYPSLELDANFFCILSDKSGGDVFYEII